MRMATDSSPADAFEALRREVALLRRALEGLAAEQKAQPDYSGVLVGIGARIREQNAALGTMAEAPALQLTPEAIGQQILRASEQVRAEDARLLGQAQNGMTGAARQIEAALASARTAHAQQRAVRWSAMLGLVIGAIVGAAGAAITADAISVLPVAGILSAVRTGSQENSSRCPASEEVEDWKGSIGAARTDCALSWRCHHQRSITT
ncbi:hypothetical protein [Sphingosinicella microcystinivorans]|nr:hypothetical protein [Sphingosinicella microcystinivorans]